MEAHRLTTPSIGLMRCTAVYALVRLTALGKMLRATQGCIAATLELSDQQAVQGRLCTVEQGWCLLVLMGGCGLFV